MNTTVLSKYFMGINTCEGEGPLTQQIVLVKKKLHKHIWIMNKSKIEIGF